MVRLRLMCGVAGAGKSTHAKQLEDAGWLRLSIDAEAWRLGHRTLPFPDGLAEQIRARQHEQLVEAVRAGRDVVVDYSFWSRAQRDDYRALGRALGAEVDVAYLPVDEAELRRRLAARAGRHSDDYRIEADVVTGYLAGFEAPAPDETDVVVVPPRHDGRPPTRGAPL
jgi:predicted kinase